MFASVFPVLFCASLITCLVAILSRHGNAQSIQPEEPTPSTMRKINTN